jgi:hypothetical protein
MLRLLLLILLLSSCHNNSKAPEKLSSRKIFDNKKSFQLISFDSKLDSNTTDTNCSVCESWKLTKENILHIVKNSEEIDGTTWDLRFVVLCCTYSGILSQEDIKYPFTINAGAFLKIKNPDTTIIMGDLKALDNKYFIVPPDD